jgi:hypothetical protein
MLDDVRFVVRQTLLCSADGYLVPGAGIEPARPLRDPGF